MDLDFFKDIKYQSHEQFLLNLVITAIITYGIGQFYIKYGTSISNRKKYAQNFLLLSLTTMLIIYIVKASVALSLGLVGALSIIRFRTAIKEPEELGYLFLNIGVGLAMGANQVFVTLIAVAVILLLLFGQAILHKKEAFNTSEHMFINILCQRSQVDPIHGILKHHFNHMLLKRMDNSSNMITLSYQISTTNMDLVIKAQDELAAFSGDIEFSFIEQRNLVF
ncbi:DUF4956 domain-containing protein [Adhaeribacter sp. BT258]|uniref:DUF4956 domain-containing protein n=1 Tax=Adhaeribacter terrigena TaxID=2793070 RepID=A0ABS1C0D5_9BACT|nr:DUF4956 domain-containing protein [Adhaeribacter terrigena]MBK0402851.1 DUF4956 domain-containing protein [Adhaeribacter terrigena]